MDNAGLQDVPILFFLNKQDLPQALPPDDLDRAFNLTERIVERDFKLQTLTALTGYIFFAVPPSHFLIFYFKALGCVKVLNGLLIC